MCCSPSPSSGPSIPSWARPQTLDTVKKAVEALEAAYKDAGYGTVFVDIPEQTVNDGVVRLKVTEGALARIHVRGERYFSGRQILAALPSLQPDQTPNLPALQRELTALNAVTPDRSIVPVLKAGATPGAVDVDLNVNDTLPLHASLQLDNRHTADTTAARATGTLSYDNLWQRQDSISLMYQTAPERPSDAEVLMLGYTAHLGAAGTLASLSYVHTDSSVLAVGTLGVLGQGSIYGAHVIQPLSATAEFTQSLNFGLDYKDVLTQVMPDSCWRYRAQCGGHAGALRELVRRVRGDLAARGPELRIRCGRGVRGAQPDQYPQ